MAQYRLLPTVIAISDDSHCSVNCKMMFLNSCRARRGSQLLKRDGNLFLRTSFCREESFETDTETGIKKSCGTCCYENEDRLSRPCDSCENLSQWRSNQ